MKALVWHWGRRGAGPLFAARLAAGLRDTPGWTARLSLAAGAEILSGPDAPECDWREPTYDSPAGFIAQRIASRFFTARTARRVAQERPDIAICAMPALLDSRMEAALHRVGIPYAVIVHDADAHPGEALRFRMLDQNRLLRGATCLFTLTRYVEESLRRQKFGIGSQIIAPLWHPPIGFADVVPPCAASARPHLLYFGRLLAYKGLDLLADALALLGPDLPFELRICGDGPDSQSLDRLRRFPSVRVEQRWLADHELPALLGWADALVLPYREASQSGVAALAVAAGRHVLATNVGGLPEQLAAVPQTIFCIATPVSIAEGLRRLVRQCRETSPPPGMDATDSWRAMSVAMGNILTGFIPAPVGRGAQARKSLAEALFRTCKNKQTDYAD